MSNVQLLHTSMFKLKEITVHDRIPTKVPTDAQSTTSSSKDEKMHLILPSNADVDTLIP